MSIQTACGLGELEYDRSAADYGLASFQTGDYCRVSAVALGRNDLDLLVGFRIQLLVYEEVA